MEGTKGADPKGDRRKVKRKGRRKVAIIDTSKAYSNADVVRLAIEDLGLKECLMPQRSQHCDVIWRACSGDLTELNYSPGQKINKFPGTGVFVKACLSRQLMTMKQLYPDDYNFFPRAWLLPAQYHDFCSDVEHMAQKRTKRRKPTFIIKPSEGAQGEGIYLLRDPRDYRHVNSHRMHVAEEYLSDVLLLDGFKFDLRIYVVVTSLDPLRVHLCREGLARLSTVPYEKPNPKNLHETFMHLTNYSLNKRSSGFQQSEKEGEGSKRKLSSVLRQLRRQGHDTDRLWREVETIVCNTLLAVVGEMRVEQRAAFPPSKPAPDCFQVIGFDILVLDDLRAMLLEVNSSPSLCITAEEEVSPGVMQYSTSQKDEEVKRAVVRDTLALLLPRRLQKRRKRRSHQKVVGTEEASAAVATEEIITSSSPCDSDVGDVSQASDEGEKAKPTELHSAHTHTPRTSNERGAPDEAGQESANGEGSKPKLCQHDSEEDDRGEEEQEEEEEEESSCLSEIYPSEYGEELQHLGVAGELADIFISCIGVRGSLSMGSTAFRVFARKCGLYQKGVDNASLDILYIEIQRRWDFLDLDKATGLGYKAFVDVCMEISRRHFSTPSTTKAQALQAFVAYCKANLRKSMED